MKNLSILGGILASLLLAAAGLAVAQDAHKNERPQTAPPAENRNDEARPEDRRNDDRRNQEPGSGDRRETTPQNEGQQKPQPQSGDRHPERQQDERQMQQPAGRQNQEQPNQQRQSMGQQEGEKDRHQQAQPQGQMQGADRARAEGREGNQRRIPDSDFRAHFGRQHRFAPGRMQVYQGRPQFTYGGYVFEVVEAWPADWVYDDDDYYIDYVDDDYWLYSFHHPGVRLGLTIVG